MSRAYIYDVCVCVWGRGGAGRFKGDIFHKAGGGGVEPAAAGGGKGRYKYNS